MNLLYMSRENNFRFYSSTVKFPSLSACVRETIWITMLMDQMS